MVCSTCWRRRLASQPGRRCGLAPSGLPGCCATDAGTRRLAGTVRPTATDGVDPRGRRAAVLRGRQTSLEGPIEFSADEYGVRTTTLNLDTEARLGWIYSGELREVPPRFPAIESTPARNVRRRERCLRALAEWDGVLTASSTTWRRSPRPGVAPGACYPTIAIDTGGGVCCVYPFSAALDLDTFGRDDRRRIARRLRPAGGNSSQAPTSSSRLRRGAVDCRSSAPTEGCSSRHYGRVTT